nr:hypothetical protein [Angustibacter aerolatus]
MTLVGFLRPPRMTVYAGEQRLTAPVRQPVQPV